eukprot:CAMPEP_0114387130 /NCGR_PEP_ID=MMETSP0102-20121206/7066_1 /TAXON_ID=38822 ORGANISM="Pteridomonas danica, Strain PT" /NCGR_SAMPLE_ID=MMETSP0102 /ASSEMBLY_ACC=CAM_ASM_000212 /LENGTH=347 /DNA_ID=CAMNT_0001544153 /DNA_START=43 /DNA_END=1086 /DNA_ORIENTATION=+
MGAGASAPGAFDRLPDMVDETTAMAILGKCFDRADWETITSGSGKVRKDTFITTISVRNHAPSLRAWLEFWRIDELLEVLESLDVMSPTDIALLEEKEVSKIGLKTVQQKHWQKAVAHGKYLESIHFDKPPSPLYLWLETWRLERIHKGLFDLGCDVKEDLIDLTEADAALLNMKLLEERRWKQATQQLIKVIRKFDFNDNTRSSTPSLETWLVSLKLEELNEPLRLLGVVELCDLGDMDDRELASLGLNKLQRKHWDMGMLQVLNAKKEAGLDGKNDDPTFRGWLESWRLYRLADTMKDLGAYVQQDLLDLEPSEYSLLKMRPLEAKRFEQAMITLEEEFQAWGEN